jgi:hypothetical protein
MIKLIIAVLIVSIYAGTKKIPIVCYGCEKVTGLAGYVFRCMNPDSRMCEIVNEMESDEHGGWNNASKLNLVTNSTFKVVSNVPEQMQGVFNDILEDIKQLGTKIKGRLSDFVAELKIWLTDMLEPLKNSAIRTFEDFYNTIIKPAKDFILEYIVEPIISIIDHLMKLKKMIVDWITNTTNDVSRQMSFFKDDAIEAIIQIPGNLISNINGIISAFNNIKTDTFANINAGIENVISGANIMIGNINEGLDTVTSSLGSVQDNINGTITNIDTEINKVYSNIDGAVADILPDIEWSLPKLTIPFSDLNVPNVPAVFITALDNVPEIDLNELKESTKENFNNVVQPLKDELDKAFSNDVFAPINELISSMSILASSLTIKFANMFDINFLGEEMFKDLWENVKNIFNQPGLNPIEVVFDFLIKPTIPYIELIQNDLSLAISEIGEKLERMFVSIADKLDNAFGTLSDITVQFGSFLTESGGYVMNYYFTDFVDRLIPLPISKTQKLNMSILLLIIIFYVVFLLPVINLLKHIDLFNSKSILSKAVMILIIAISLMGGIGGEGG